ncbi:MULTISPECIES: DMT family transporter [unclassified Rhodococcus (in: high G+C Gram-positive bacteria)]|uniref:DMT family transporter n=1 Tax=unclassified Rhodococcus (in: high G+C Gram-positive bacteria) TaxID=192944 RepID=UPI000A6253D0|nr:MULTISPECIES: DMT family transporter [unclassified Rhodococcus (in: high G+C Gram-positive bacteria)]MDQ1201844.1 drug/metabolite transporter (DMT)-like permease [Rhodococcus sp. SORGH_AS_0303]
MSSSVLAVGLSLVAAFLFACAAVAQQTAASAVADGDSLISGLVRSPRWWAGVVGDLGGYLVQVAALAVGSVSVVQPLLVSMLLFALPLAAKYSGLRMRRATWISAVGLTVALVAFVAVGDPTEGTADAPLSVWALPLAAVVAVALVGAVAGVLTREPGRAALLLGVGGGLLFGVAVAFTKYVTDLVESDLLGALTAWQTYALIAAGVSGFYLQQRAFQAGPLAASLPAVTVCEPLAAVFLGIVVLDERLRLDGLRGVVVASAVIVMIVTTVVLSREQGRADDAVPVV